MEQFETEEQQVEAIKAFFRENGLALAAGIVLGLGGLWGFRYYQDSQIAAKEMASEAYTQAVDAVVAGNSDDLTTFVQAYSDSGYALLAEIVSSQLATEKQDYKQALVALDAALAKTDDVAIRDLLSLRKAKAQYQLAEYAAAVSTIATIQTSAFAASAQALLGDVQSAQQNWDEAQAAYTASLAIRSDQVVQAKLDNLGYLASSSVAE